MELEDYVTLADLEAQGKIDYSGVQDSSEENHREIMRTDGRLLQVYPKDIEFYIETTGVPGLTNSWYHHLYPNKRLEWIFGMNFVPQRGSDIILWREHNIIHLNPKGSEEKIDFDVLVFRVYS